MNIKEIKNFLTNRIKYHQEEYNWRYNSLVRSASLCRHMRIHEKLLDDLRFIYNCYTDKFYDDLKYTLNRLNESINYNKNKYDRFNEELDYYGYDSSTARDAIMYKKIYEEEIQYKECIEFLING